MSYSASIAFFFRAIFSIGNREHKKKNARGGHYTCASKIDNIFYHNDDAARVLPIDKDVIEKKAVMIVLYA